MPARGRFITSGGSETAGSCKRLFGNGGIKPFQPGKVNVKVANYWADFSKFGVLTEVPASLAYKER